MLNSLRTFFIKKKLESELEPFKGEMSDSKVGILFNADVSDKYQLEKLIEEHFEVKASEVVCLGFSRHSYAQVEKLEHVFTLKDFSVFGQPNADLIQEFLEHKFKFLFNFFGKDELCLELVAHLSHAQLKIGLTESNAKINDVSLALQTKNLDFFKESSKYIKHII